MLETLDTLIGFTAVMLGVSLFITALTQVVGNVLALRGSNLRRGVADLLSTVHPGLKAKADDIARQVLQHPAVSDSSWASLDALKARHPKWLAFLDWWPLKGLSSRWRQAGVIRVEELVGVLDKLAAGTQPPAGPPASTWTSQQAMAYIAQQARQKLSPEVDERIAQLQALVASLPGGGAAATGLTQVQVSFDQLLKEIPANAEAKLGELSAWFDGAMDRATHRFSRHARAITAVLALVFVGVTHLDALKLWRQISDDSELRAALVAGSEEMLETAEGLLALEPAVAMHSAGAPPPPVSEVMQRTMKQVLGEEIEAAEDAAKPTLTEARDQAPTVLVSPDEAMVWLQGELGKAQGVDFEVLEGKCRDAFRRGWGTARGVPQVYQATASDLLAARADELAGTGEQAREGRFRDLAPTAPAFPTRAEAAEWLQAQLADDPGLAELKARFDAAVNSNLAYDRAWLMDQATALRERLAAPGLEIIPDPLGPFWPWRWDLSDPLGLLISFVLLSLGAPFWFNLLKNLTNLRPLLASKEDKESQRQAA